jgi:hypothetical protein
LALVFGVLNIYGAPIESFRTAGDPPSISTDTLSQRTSFLNRILIDLRDDYAARFYHAVAQATLGRNYQARYLHPNHDAPAVVGEPSDGNDAIDESVIVPTRPLLPWRDFVLEYPPGMLAAIVFPALFTSDTNSYFVIFSLEMELFLTLAVFLSVRTADLLGANGTRVLSQSLFLTGALGVVAVRRYDPSVALAISATIYWFAARRPGLSGAAFALGVAVKGVPLLLAPIFALWFGARGDWPGFRRASASFVACVGVFAIGYLAAAGPHALDSFAYHASRPVQMESIYSAFLMELRSVSPQVMSIERSYGSYNVVSPFEPLLRTVANIAVLSGILASYVWAYKRIRTARDDSEKLTSVIFASCACLVAVISLGKVSNSQYLVWLIPIGALAGVLSAGDGRWRLVIACALAQTVYPFLYTTIIAGQLTALGGVIIFARNFSLWRWLFKIANDPLAAPPLAGVGPLAKHRTAHAEGVRPAMARFVGNSAVFVGVAPVGVSLTQAASRSPAKPVPARKGGAFSDAAKSHRQSVLNRIRTLVAGSRIA